LLIFPELFRVSLASDGSASSYEGCQESDHASKRLDRFISGLVLCISGLVLCISGLVLLRKIEISGKPWQVVKDRANAISTKDA
jgi:hypothetical protein